METLTIKELAPYLENGILAKLSQKGILNQDDDYPNPRTREIGIIKNISFWGEEITGQLHVSETYSFDFDEIDEVDILVRPLSDLTKPITHNGETFVPMEKLCNDFCNRTPCNPEFGKSKILMHADNGGGLKWWFVYHRNKMTFELSDDNREMSNHTIPQYEMFQKLFEWHFDVFGLIERNLAIDINTTKIAHATAVQ